ncbi:MAG: hypothetical protein IJD33_06275, partial [Clostridia bacterium]|nr:hypothetical protein [Clostridia bacterium]
MKKKLAVLLSGLLAIGCFSGCDLSALLGGDNSSTDGENSSITSDVGELVYEKLLGEQAEKTLAVGETVSFDIKKDLGDRNYMKIDFASDANLYGEFVYSDLSNAAKVVKECFYLQAGDTEFKQFLDAYRPNGIGLFEKHLQSVTLTNVGNKAGKVKLNGVSVSDRDIPEVDCEIYLERNSLKVGVDLALGGSITFISRTDYQGQTVDEIVDKDGNV